MNNAFCRTHHVMILLIFLAIPALSLSQQTRENAAFIFSYHPRDGSEALFENGYKMHLEWHRQKKDQLVWYGWYVLTGSRVGLFIDGTFGISFGDFDNRVDMRGDRSNFTQTTAPFVELESRTIYAFREDLSTEKLLEDGNPSSRIQVLHFVINIGRELDFEKILRDMKDYLSREADAPVISWYRLIDGGENTGYMLMMPKYNWKDYGAPSISLGALMDEAGLDIRSLAGMIASSYSETWGYREDLSYFPSRE